MPGRPTEFAVALSVPGGIVVVLLVVGCAGAGGCGAYKAYHESLSSGES